MNTLRFHTQSILAAETREICALEILSRRLPNFDDEVEMLELDIAALEHAALLADRTGLRIHCNMEYSSLILAPWRRLRDHIRPGVVIELVERNELLMVSGFTDDKLVRSDNPFADNLELSAQRALTVTRALIAEGMPSAQVFAAAFGAEQPVAPNVDEAGRARNRRVEMAPVPRASGVKVAEHE